MPEDQPTVITDTCGALIVQYTHKYLRGRLIEYQLQLG